MRALTLAGYPSVRRRRVAAGPVPGPGAGLAAGLRARAPGGPGAPGARD